MIVKQIDLHFDTTNLVPNMSDLLIFLPLYLFSSIVNRKKLEIFYKIDINCKYYKIIFLLFYQSIKSAKLTDYAEESIFK